MGIESSINKKVLFAVMILLIITSVAAFGRIAGHDFINFDDNKYITENNHTKSGFNQENIKWILTSVVVGNWHPLTMFSHTLDWRLFGNNASGHHVISLLLHIGAVVFLFLFLSKTTRNLWPSAFAAALFALHPLRVESVAWLAERKDVLSMFFGTACLYAYAFYIEKNSISRYLLCLILFILALMSKPMLVTLPFALMLLDYWPLGRWQKAFHPPVGEKINAGKLVLEKIPFIFLAIASAIMTFFTHTKGSFVTSLVPAPFLTRLANAAVSYAVYLKDIIWPTNLVVYYPYDFSLPAWKIITSALVLLCITVVVLYSIKKFPFLFVGWFWYLGTLLPVIGIVQVGTQAMADRYTYLPSIGIAFMISWGVPLFFSRGKNRTPILLPLAIAVLIILTVLTWRQCGYWKNSLTLFSRALQLTKNNYVAHNHFASALLKAKSFDKAIDHYNEAIRINPVYAHAYYNRGIAYYTSGQKMRALDDFKSARDMIPKIIDYASVFSNIGVIYTDLGQYQLAIDHFNEAIRLDPFSGETLNKRAYAYFKTDNLLAACRDARKACEIGNCKILRYLVSQRLCR